MKLPTKLELQRFRRTDRAILMVCIGIAFFFWTLNRLSNAYRSAVNVQLEYRLPVGKAFSREPIHEVKALLQGKGWDFLVTKHPKVPVNVSGDSFQTIQSGRIREIVADQLGLGIDAIHLDFDEIKLRVEDEVSKLVPVVGISDLSFRKGFDLTQPIQLNPFEVEVKGPKSIVDTLRFVKTDTLRLSKLREDLTCKIRVSFNPLFRYNVQEVEALIKVEQFTEKSMFVPVSIKNAPTTIKIFPDKIKLTCTMGLSQYMKINPTNFTAEVDFKGVTPDVKNNTLPIALIFSPANVQEVKFTPKSVEFYFEK